MNTIGSEERLAKLAEVLGSGDIERSTKFCKEANIYITEMMQAYQRRSARSDSSAAQPCGIFSLTGRFDTPFGMRDGGARFMCYAGSVEEGEKLLLEMCDDNSNWLSSELEPPDRLECKHDKESLSRLRDYTYVDCAACQPPYVLMSLRDVRKPLAGAHQ